MGKRANYTTKDYITNASLPVYPGNQTYAIIPHKDIIDKTHEILSIQGFEIKEELYRCNQNAEICSGVYHLWMTAGADTDTDMMFAWSNSYDKSMRFKCSIGAKINVNQSYMISGDIASSWSRKHTGNALAEAVSNITSQLISASKYYNQLVRDKNEMKEISVGNKQVAELLGRLFFLERILTTEQVAWIRTIMAVAFNDNTTPINLWSLYTILAEAMKKAHPRLWLDHQRQLHWFICNEFGIGGFVAKLPITGEVYGPVGEPDEVDPAQISLLDSIAELENKQSLPEKNFDL